MSKFTEAVAAYQWAEREYNVDGKPYAEADRLSHEKIKAYEAETGRDFSEDYQNAFEWEW